VSYYRLYVLSAPEGRFVGFEEIEAEDDAAAIRRAEEFVGERPLELWCGSRKVCGFAVQPKAQAIASRGSQSRASSPPPSRLASSRSPL
jgi:hypothetical protein